MTFDGSELYRFWLADYAPELIAVESGRYPAIDAICSGIGGAKEVRVVPIPIDCTDGFTEAFYARPEKFLDAAVRRAQSAWGFVTEAAQARFVKNLADDLASGAWDKKYGHWRKMPHFEGSLRLIISRAEDRKTISVDSR